MMGQPSSPGMWVSELRFGGVKVNAGETAVCIDMAVAPAGPSNIMGTTAIWRRPSANNHRHDRGR
jgi:hypothetical protein